VLLGVITVAQPNGLLSHLNWVSCLISVLFGVIAWGLFVNICFHDIVRAVDGDFDYGPSGILVLIAFLLSFITAILQIVSAVKTPAAPSNAAPATEAKGESEMVATNEV
jgi:hypothetical protein